MNDLMHKVAEELLRIVEEATRELETLDAERARFKPAPDVWSVQELIGHLIDSAVNNHHRFIRAQEVEELIFPRYEQNSWVSLQDYQASSWPELLALWQLYNRHLARVIGRIPPQKESVVCRIGPFEPVTLGFLVEDYLVHLNHHLRQIHERRERARTGGA
jgi:hypothetical protein